MSEMIRVCTVCGKEFDTAPYYIREGKDWMPVCSPYCLRLKDRAEDTLKYE